jgi:glycosyltransferase involved in cell wall biosynthesis
VNVGFHIRYERSDATYMVFQMARRVLELGFDVEILPVETPQVVHPHWDKYVLKSNRTTYWDWVKRGHLSYVIFNEVPRVEWLQAAMAEGLKCYLLCFWENIREEDIPVLPVFTNVICPSRNVQRLLVDRLNLTNSMYIPWDPGVPITHEDRLVDAERIGVFWPLSDSQCYHQEFDMVPIVSDVMRACPQMYLTVTYSSNMPETGVKTLKNLYNLADGRAELMKNLSWEKEQLLFGKHDLTIWPTRMENVGLVGLSSVYMGTPVMTFDHPLVGEFIRDGRNGLLVPCELRYNFLGVPYVEADYRVFANALVNLVRDPEKIDQLRETVTHGLAARRETHRSTLDDLFV